MATWYKVRHYTGKIEPLEVIKETDKFVSYSDTFFGGRIRREAKDGTSESVHPTFQAAKLELIARLSQKLMYAREEVARLERDVRRANELIGPGTPGAEETTA